MTCGLSDEQLRIEMEQLRSFGNGFAPILEELLYWREKAQAEEAEIISLGVLEGPREPGCMDPDGV